MNRADLGKALSLSCVENYFLGYFQGKFDVRFLYAESFVPFREVTDSFLNGQANYENYPLIRLQETSEKLGITVHRYRETFRYQNGALNLIRVNRAFFQDAKLLPWRADHYIAIEKAECGYIYWNNYPLSEGRMTESRLHEVYDEAILSFEETGEFNDQKYSELSGKQYRRITDQKVGELKITEDRFIRLRDALLVLKVLRKRTDAWLCLESERKNFSADPVFLSQTNELIGAYESLITAIQLQIARKRAEVNILNDKLALLCESERLWSNEIQIRRG